MACVLWMNYTVFVPWFTIATVIRSYVAIMCLYKLCILIAIQECLQLLQLLHTELSDSKQQVEKLESQYQQLQVI